MKVVIYREIMNIPNFPQSFNDLMVGDFEFDLIDISGIDTCEDIDKILSEKVREGKSAKPDLVFIPAILGLPLAYNGIRLSMHWRLDPEKCDYLNTPIVILGVEEFDSFFKNCDCNSFLRSPKVNYLNYSEEAIKKFLSTYIVPSDHDEALDLKYYFVRPPSSYKSHHSITNEWCILRWAEALGLLSMHTDRIKEVIGHSLYYKYLKAKNPITIGDKAIEKVLINQGKVLYIDDEINKGWDIIFKKIIPSNLTVFGDEFKSMDNIEVIDKSIEIVNSIDPDLVILDLRLHEDDFDSDKVIEDLSGYKILVKIKELNKGIQVIIFSSTNKLYNLAQLQIANVDGFILKEAPETSINASFTKNSLSNIYCQIDNRLKMKFLKRINLKIHTVLETIKRQTSRGLSALVVQFYTRTVQNLNLSFELFNASYKNEKYKNHGYLQLFQIIEDFLKVVDFIDHGASFYIKCKTHSILVADLKIDKSVSYYDSAQVYNNYDYTVSKGRCDLKKLDTFFMVSALLLFRYGLSSTSSSKWSAINGTRNTKAAHGGNTNVVSVLEIEDLLDFLIFIMDDNNQNESNLNKGL